MRPIGATFTGQPDVSLATRWRDLRLHLEAGLIGGQALTERLLIGLLTGGHLLVEGAPGLAKTRAVKLLASGINAPFARIQCTPDLMPSDLTGTSIWRQDRNVFEFVEGPIFNALVLVDEINRAPPKVQSALLEAMGERQVTAAGITRALPQPFMVIGTQNPIEHEGTFPLPEAQLDRFMLHVEVHLPDAARERLILDLVEAETLEQTGAVAQIASFAALTPAEIAQGQKAAMRVFLSPAIKDYMVRLVTAARRTDVVADLSAKIEHPASPRGTLALAAGCKARAWLAGRDHVVPQDVAELATDILAHRTILTWRALADGDTPRKVITAMLGAIYPL